MGRHTGLTTALLYFFVISFLGLRYHIVGDGEAESDFFGAYVVQARAFLHGDIVIDSFRGPAYPMALGLLSAVLMPLGAGLFETGIVLSALSAAVVLFLGYRLLRSVFSERIAQVTTLLVVLNPIFIRYSYTTGTDMFFVAVAVLAMLLVLGTDRMVWWRIVAAGAALALAYLTRYNGAVLLVAACVAIVFVNVWTLGWKRRIVAAGALIAVFAFFITPWGIHCYSSHGAFFYNHNYRNVLMSLMPPDFIGDTLRGVDLRQIDSLPEVFAAFSGELFSSLPGRALDQFVGGMGRLMRWPLGVAVILGLVLVGTRRPTRRQLAYYLFGILFFLGLLLVFFNERFGLLLIPMYAAVAVAGLDRVWNVRGPGSRIRVVVTVVLALLVILGATASVTYNRSLIRGRNPEIRELGRKFVANIPARELGRKVAARKPDFSYFAGLEPLPLPVVNTHDQLLGYLRDRGAGYLLFSGVAWRTRPQLRYLGDVERQHPGLTLVFVSESAALYRVEPE